MKLLQGGWFADALHTHRASQNPWRGPTPRWWRYIALPCTRLLAPGTQNQRRSPALPSFLAQFNEVPPIFPSALLLLFAEENTTGPKSCRLPQALAALVANRQILHVRHVPKCTEPHPESPATGPSSGRVKQKRKSSALTLSSCFSASSH